MKFLKMTANKFKVLFQNGSKFHVFSSVSRNTCFLWERIVVHVFMYTLLRRAPWVKGWQVSNIMGGACATNGRKIHARMYYC